MSCSFNRLTSNSVLSSPTMLEILATEGRPAMESCLCRSCLATDESLSHVLQSPALMHRLDSVLLSLQLPSITDPSEWGETRQFIRLLKATLRAAGATLELPTSSLHTTVVFDPCGCIQTSLCRTDKSICGFRGRPAH